MASTSIDNEDSSEPILDYLKRKFRWLPNHVNPDFILVFGIFGIFFDVLAVIKILLKLEGTNGDYSESIILDWIKINFQELFYILLLMVFFMVLLIFSNTAIQRILRENTFLKVPLEEFLNFINEPRIARFYMHLFLILTGFLILRELADRNFPVVDTLQFMIAWFVLLILMPLPDASKSGIDPFTENDL